MAEDSKAKQIINEFDQLKTLRANWEWIWHQITDVIAPRRSGFIGEEVPGTKRRSRILNAVGEEALDNFAGGFATGLIPKANRWFFLTVPQDVRGDISKEGQQWLKNTTDKLFEVFSAPKTGFYLHAHEFITDLGGFGTAIMFVGDRPGDLPLFRNHSVAECYFSTNDDGVVDTVYRKFRLTARQAFLKFGEKLPQGILDASKKSSNDKFWFIHAVRPRPDGVVGEIPTKKPWSSQHVALDGHKLVDEEGGFDELPYIVSRWNLDSGNENYGRSPGMMALGECQMLQVVRRDTIKSLQKMVDPAYDVPDDGYVNRLDTRPGALNYRRQGLGKDEFIRPLLPPGRPEFGLDTIREMETRIRNMFFWNVFELPGPVTAEGSVQHMSATEVSIRANDQLKKLGPMTSRQETEFLDPLIFRTLRILFRNGILGEIPEELLESGFEIQYESPLAVAARSQDINVLQLFQSVMLPLAQVNPNVMDRLNPDEITKDVADTLRLPPNWTRSDQEIDQIRQQQADAESANQDLQQGQVASESAKNISEVIKNVGESQAQ